MRGRFLGATPFDGLIVLGGIVNPDGTDQKNLTPALDRDGRLLVGAALVGAGLLGVVGPIEVRSCWWRRARARSAMSVAVAASVPAQQKAPARLR